MSENNRQGFVLGKTREGEELIAQRGRTRIFPIRIIDKGKSFSKPYPLYTGSARLEGTSKGSLVRYWIEGRGFQPALLHILSLRMEDKDGPHYFGTDEGLFVMSIVRYTEVGRPEIRTITEEAPPEVAERFGWNRVPVLARGTTPEEREQELRNLIQDLREGDSVLSELSEDKQKILEKDIPF